MNISKLTQSLALIVSISLTTASASLAGLIPSGSTLDQLLAPGMFMELDGFRFESFEVNPLPPTSFQPDPSDITVSLSRDAANRKVNLVFTISGANRILREGEDYDFRLEFDAHASSGRLFNAHQLDIGAFVDGEGEVAVFESIDSIGPAPETLLALGTFVDKDFNRTVDSGNLSTPNAWLHIRKDIGVFGGSASGGLQFAGLTDFREVFMYDFVPEPASGMLMLIGAMAMTGVRRRK